MSAPTAAVPSGLASTEPQDPNEQVSYTITASTSLTLPTHPKVLTYAELNPVSDPTEFFGVWGTAFVTLMCPTVVYFLYYGCNETTGCHPTSVQGWKNVWAMASRNEWPSSAGKWWEWETVPVVAAFFAYLIGCWVVLPAEWTKGGLLRDGTRKEYKLNGMSTFILTCGLIIGYLSTPGGIETFSWAYDHWCPLISTALAIALLQNVFFYAQSYWSGELLAEGGNSGYLIYDFFLGRPLNPTIPGFAKWDVKTFTEVRPGLIGWVLLNVSCACEQYIRIGRLTDSMVLVLIFEAYYVVDSLWNEANILTQMDITTDGYGFMLTFGNLVWVPFLFGVQARYLAFNPIDLGLQLSAFIFVWVGVGLWIFRSANGEKDAFRNGRNPKNLEYMETKRGTKLLTSGWWGWSRHPNYFGDWIMAVGWSFPTGFNTPFTYAYILYFVVLLLHRQIRDDHACKKKYGADWEKYCGKVPYRIIKYVFQAYFAVLIYVYHVSCSDDIEP